MAEYQLLSKKVRDPMGPMLHRQEIDECHSREKQDECLSGLPVQEWDEGCSDEEYETGRERARHMETALHAMDLNGKPPGLV